jgi:hypothetical protein
MKAKCKKAKRDQSLNEPRPALPAKDIFGDEWRPAIIEASRAMGDQVNAADVDRQVAALWDAETDKLKYYDLSRNDRERYADEKAAFDWDGGAATQAAKKKPAIPGTRAASVEDTAQIDVAPPRWAPVIVATASVYGYVVKYLQPFVVGMTGMYLRSKVQAAQKIAMPENRAASFGNCVQTPPAHDAAPPQWASTSAVAASVYNCAGGYLRPFLVVVDGWTVDPKTARHQRTRWAALQLMAADRGPLRAPTCNHTLRAASAETATGQALLRRALSLLSPGELQELRLPGEGATWSFIQSAVEQEKATASVFALLRVIQGGHVRPPVAVMQQCAATLTELDCFAAFRDDFASVLQRCTRLESLSLCLCDMCPPAAWLGLSQLHTLRGVSLRDVPAATIAAALPRLHTLHVDHRGYRVDFTVDSFYDELLPRLRSFGLDGAWPKAGDGMEIDDALFLLLEDLKWNSTASIPRQFMGARPFKLNASDADLIRFLQTAGGAGADSPIVTSPLARVGALTIRFGLTFARWLPQKPTATVRLLRAAPHLRRLTLDARFDELMRDFLTDAFTPVPAFTGVIHPTLRHLAITNNHPPVEVQVPGDCGALLRQRHFPALRRLTVYDEEYPVWVRQRFGQRTSLFP